MKWFKHDANAVLDSKLRRLRTKYGMEGYGLYWYCLECVARNVESHNLTFELEEDAELISVDTGIHQERVQEMMLDMVKWGLFEESQGRITCLKMATRTDEYTQKLIKNTKCVPTMSRQTPDSVGIKSELIEEKRREEIGESDKPTARFKPPSVDEVNLRIIEMGYRYVTAEEFCDFYGSKNWMVGKNKMADWHKALGGWESRGKKEMAKRNGGRVSDGEVSYW